jgi:hypothetical protein
MYPDSSVSLDWKLDKAKAMLVFMAPALILPLSDPLMSLIDAYAWDRCAAARSICAIFWNTA